MAITLPADLTKQVEQEISSGHFHGAGELIEEAVRRFLGDRQRGKRRMDALGRIGHAVDQAGLYEQVHVPSDE
jgi:Arc/MetJ-type ribon-helix-helix transcriptional regulator